MYYPINATSLSLHQPAFPSLLRIFPSLSQSTLDQYLEKICWEVCQTKTNHLSYHVFDGRIMTKDHIRAHMLEELKESFIILNKLKPFQHQDQVSVWRTSHTYPQVYADLKLKKKKVSTLRLLIHFTVILHETKIWPYCVLWKKLKKQKQKQATSPTYILINHF